MGKSQYDLFMEIIKRFNDKGILNGTIVIGSWCVYLYKKYFKDNSYESSFKTRDVDFLVPNANIFKKKIDVKELLKDLGFIVTIDYPQGYIKLKHTDLIIEFLVPDKGRGVRNPFPLPLLGVNATALRYLGLLSKNTIEVCVDNINIKIPHPVNYGLHKLIISQLRKNREKAENDFNAGVKILKALVATNKSPEIITIFNALPKKWRNLILKALKDNERQDILSIIYRASPIDP